MAEEAGCARDAPGGTPLPASPETPEPAAGPAAAADSPQGLQHPNAATSSSSSSSSSPAAAGPASPPQLGGGGDPDASTTSFPQSSASGSPMLAGSGWSHAISGGQAVPLTPATPQSSVGRQGTTATIGSDCPSMRLSTAHQFQSFASGAPPSERESRARAPTLPPRTPDGSPDSDPHGHNSGTSLNCKVHRTGPSAFDGPTVFRLAPAPAAAAKPLLTSAGGGGGGGGGAAAETASLSATWMTDGGNSSANYRCSADGRQQKGVVVLREFDQAYEYERFFPCKGWRRVKQAGWLSAFYSMEEEDEDSSSGSGSDDARLETTASDSGSLRSEQMQSMRSNPASGLLSAGAGHARYGTLDTIPSDAFKPRRRRPQTLREVACRPGWEWDGDWVVTKGWEYSTLSQRDKAFTRKPTRDRWYYMVRRRRWIRHRVKSVAENGAKGVMGLSAAVQADFFPESGERLEERSLTVFRPLCDAMKKKLGKRTKTPAGARVEAFSGKQAVDFMLGSGKDSLPSGVSRTFSKGNRGEVARFLDEELRMRGLLVSVEPRPAGIAATIAEATVGACQEGEGGGVEAKPAAPAGFSTAAHMNSQALEDNGTLFYVQDSSSVTAAEVYQGVIEALMPDVAWLSDISFDTSSKWFKGVTAQIAVKNKELDDYASEHRHRWKSASYECFRCKDMLIQEGVITLVCGHSICSECCKVCLERDSHRGKQSLDAALPPPGDTHLLVCAVCHRPSSVRKIIKPNGVKGFEADNTLLFVWHIDTIYENQRRTLFSKFSRKHLLPSDRHGFSDAFGMRVPDPKDVIVPSPDWHYVEPWNPKMGGKTDGRGWQYAFNWRNMSMDDPSWSPSPARLRFVRRRCLQRLRINASGSQHLRMELAKQIQLRYNPSTTFSSLYKRVSSVPTDSNTFSGGGVVASVSSL